jgi:hypothetical protein
VIGLPHGGHGRSACPPSETLQHAIDLKAHLLPRRKRELAGSLDRRLRLLGFDFDLQATLRLPPAGDSSFRSSTALSPWTTPPCDVETSESIMTVFFHRDFIVEYT